MVGDGRSVQHARLSLGVAVTALHKWGGAHQTSNFSLFREGLDMLLLQKLKKKIKFNYFFYLEFYLLSINSNSCFLSQNHVQKV